MCYDMCYDNTYLNGITGFEPVRQGVTYLNGITGFEPVRQGVKVLCLTAWLYPNYIK